MRLIDLIALCGENSIITVWDTNDAFVTEYDGKNSIDERYNDCKVLGVSGRSNSKYEAIDVVVEAENA